MILQNQSVAIISHCQPKTHSNNTPQHLKLNLPHSQQQEQPLTLKNPTTEDAGISFRQKLDYLKSLNINTQKALKLNPSLRTTNLTTLKTTQQILTSCGLTLPSISRIIDMHPQLLTSPSQNNIIPVIDFLIATVQIPPHQIPKAISRCPRLLISDVESQLKPTFLFLHYALGFKGKNKLTCKTSLLLMSSVEDTLLRKIEFLMSLGFSYGDVCNMVLRCPALLTYSVELNFKPKLEFLIGVMMEEGKGKGEGEGAREVLKRFPQYFAFSLEGRIKPRFRVLKECGLRMRLDDMLKVSDGEFRSRVVEALELRGGFCKDG